MNGIKEIWEGFETDDAFQQRVSDSFKTLPCKKHEEKIKKLSARNLIFAVMGITGFIILILEGLNYLKTLLGD